MGILGSYLVLKIAGEVVAESTNVNLKLASKVLETTSQDNGVNAGYEAGGIKIAIAGRFLYVAEGNWDVLYDYIGGEMGVGFFRNGVEFLNGYGVLKSLSLKGADSKERITGTYGIRYNYLSSIPSVEAITTESEIELITETGETLIIE